MEPKSMVNYLRFESTVPDEGKWTDRGNVLEPAGIEHARLFVSHLPSSIKVVDGPWNEEDYAWEFLTRCGGINISVLIGQQDADDWLVQVIPVAAFACLRRRKIGLAVNTVTNAIDGLLRGDARFKNVRRYSEAEFRAQERATGNE
jgi:hypothetical protein